ncbi:MAG: hypothetical protein R2911_05320 [Caldilineaceae bacterium]
MARHAARTAGALSKIAGGTDEAGRAAGAARHGALIENWAERTAQIQAHHANRLERMAEAAEDGATVFEIGQRVFNLETLTPHEVRFAVSETLAHVDYLVQQGVLARGEGAPFGYWRTA